jgi:poly-gamma-glutamate synthesis protein (capsule biosynthesis protein)
VIEATASGPSWGRVRGALHAARREADVVVVSLHWGPNMRPSPSKEFVRYAHALVEEGADVVHGHSAHVLQPIEVYRGRPILYDCGDFVDDYMVDPLLRNDWTLIHRVVLDSRNRPVRLELMPCLIDASTCQVNAAEGEAFQAIADRVLRQTERFGTPVRVSGRRLELDLSEAADLSTTRPVVEKR